ncbi:hypothetical protein ACFQ0M_37450 [Kitasatospora aburaviensis]
MAGVLLDTALVDLDWSLRLLHPVNGGPACDRCSTTGWWPGSAVPPRSRPSPGSAGAPTGSGGCARCW